MRLLGEGSCIFECICFLFREENRLVIRPFFLCALQPQKKRDTLWKESVTPIVTVDPQIFNRVYKFSRKAVLDGLTGGGGERILPDGENIKALY